MMKLAVSNNYWSVHLGLPGINFHTVCLIMDLSNLWILYTYILWIVHTCYYELMDLSSNLINIIQWIQEFFSEYDPLIVMALVIMFIIK